MNESDFSVLDGGSFTIADYSVFGVLLTASLAIGLYFGFFSKEEQTTEEYLLGGHKMKTVPIAISLVARYIDTNQKPGSDRFCYSSHLSLTTHIIALIKCVPFQPIVSHCNYDDTCRSVLVRMAICAIGASSSHYYAGWQLSVHTGVLSQQHRQLLRRK